MRVRFQVIDRAEDIVHRRGESPLRREAVIDRRDRIAAMREVAIDRRQLAAAAAIPSAPVHRDDERPRLLARVRLIEIEREFFSFGSSVDVLGAADAIGRHSAKKSEQLERLAANLRRAESGSAAFRQSARKLPRAERRREAKRAGHEREHGGGAPNFSAAKGQEREQERAGRNPMSPFRKDDCDDPEDGVGRAREGEERAKQEHHAGAETNPRTARAGSQAKSFADLAQGDAMRIAARAASKRSIGSRKGSALRRKVW